MTPLWPGARLLVPTQVDALVLGTLDLGGGRFVQAGPDYTQLRFGKSPTPGPFQPPSGVGVPQVGVQLHWTVPAGLRSGTTGADGQVSFPLLPNRWLLIRSHTPDTAPAGTAPTLDAWLIQSDVDSQDSAAVPFPDPSSPVGYTLIGNPIPLTTTATDTASTEKRLYAMGPGDPTYGVVYQGTQTVLGFHDPLTRDGSSLAPGVLGYLVVGYSNPTDWDPLLGVSADDPHGFTTTDQWAALIAALAMQVGDGSAADLDEALAAWRQWAATHGVDPSTLPTAQQDRPGQLLLHGGVQQIVWAGPDQTYGSSAPASDSVQVAVGNTAFEALGVWLEQLVPSHSVPGYSVERLVEALATDQLTTFVSDPVAFESALHGRQFGRRVGGTTWTVSQPRTGYTDQTRDTYRADQAVDLDDTQTAALVKLTRAQDQADTVSRALTTREWSLFAARWKAGQRPGDPTVKAAVSAFEAQVTALQAALDQATRAVDAARSALEALLGTKWELAPSSSVGFSLPNDPVVLLSNLKSDDTYVQVDADGDPVSLPCRATGQAISAFPITADGVTADLDAQALAATLDLAFLDRVLLPGEARDLVLETLMLDPGVVAWLASTWLASGGQGATLVAAEAALTAVQDALRDGKTLDRSLEAGLLAAALDVVGVPPDPIANQRWVQPWSPVYLDWELKWFPTAASPAGTLHDWALDELDFRWTDTAIGSNGVSYSGRALLNSNGPKALSARIDRFLASPSGVDLPDYQRLDLQAVAQRLATSDVLTQSLSGFTDLLQQRIPGRATGQVGSGDATTDDATLPNPPLQPNESDEPFQPFRAGHFQLTRVAVVDAFGQSVRVTAPGGGPIVPYRAETVVTPGAANGSYLQLPPRICQPARLDLQLVDAEDDGTPATSADATTPVCGYLVPNYLDGGLLVYDHAGSLLGQLLPIQKDAAATGVRWDAAPGRDQPLGSTPSIPNPHLAAVVSAMLEAGRNGTDALQDVVDLMDGCSPFTQPAWGTVGELAVLIGSPVAVVRASAQFALFGDAVADQAWPNTGKHVTDGFPAVPLPTRIGDLGFSTNGVVGYFADDDYSTLFAAYGYDPSAAEAARQRLRPSPARVPSGYVQTNHLLQLAPMSETSSAGTDAPVAPPAPTMLTVLMDPRRELPAISGLLPVIAQTLAPGPVTAALGALTLSFRAGPLLVDPTTIKMPLPADLQGSWELVWRDTVTTWTTGEVGSDPSTARLGRQPLRLTEGWLQLHGALSNDRTRS